MDEKGRITGGDERVGTGVAADGEVASAVDAEGFGDVAGVALEDGLEAFDGGVLEDELGGVAEGCPWVVLVRNKGRGC
jgi:hypothetical protein